MSENTKSIYYVGPFYTDFSGSSLICSQPIFGICSFKCYDAVSRPLRLSTTNAVVITVDSRIVILLLDVTTAVRTADRDMTAGDSRDTVDDEVGFVDVKTLVDCWGVFLPMGDGGTLLP